MSADVWLGWVSPVALIIVALVGGWYSFVNRRGGEKAKRRDMQPPSWEAVWAHMKSMEEAWERKFATQALETQAARDEITLMRTTAAIKDRAVTNILMAFSDQWPPDRDKPVFNTADIDVLGDTMPHKFRPTKR